MVEGGLTWPRRDKGWSGRGGGGGGLEKLWRQEDSIHFVSKNNKLYLHDYNKLLQYCKSYLKLIIDSF